MVFLIFLVSFAVSFVGFPIIIPRLKRAGIVGKNMNSESKEKILSFKYLARRISFS